MSNVEGLTVNNQHPFDYKIKDFLSNQLNTTTLTSCCLLSAYFILFIWGFFTNGIYALGINATVFSLLTILLIAKETPAKKVLDKSNMTWLIPSIIMSLSFFLYENPFIKLINLFAFPSLALFFLWFSLHQEQVKWGKKIFNKYISAINYLVAFCIPDSIKWLVKRILTLLALKPETAASICKGALPLIIAYLFLIPMLASADKLFDNKLSIIINFLSHLLSMAPIYKFLVFILITSSLIGILALVNQTIGLNEEESTLKEIKDSISSAIMLGGILILYMLFIWVQVERLFVTDLPINFAETERYVKTGFWQLFFISLFNLALSYSYYGKTTKNIRYLLGVFNTASLLMLFSSAQRLGLYVFFYGFSYEKFYASYTVLYCALLLGFLVYATFTGEKKDPVKFGFYLLLTMYSLVTVLPVEKIIFESNLIFSKRADTRINITEMRMLSIDVVNQVTREKLNTDTDWSQWEQRIKDRHEKKSFYEYTLSDIGYLLKNKN